jgi:hypothetical protein
MWIFLTRRKFFSDFTVEARSAQDASTVRAVEALGLKMEIQHG